MSDSLIPLLMIIVASAGVAAGMLFLGWICGRPKKTHVDRGAYECGIEPFDAVERHRFSVRFYLVAMLFILFDIEAAFLIPWAVTFNEFTSAKVFVLTEMAIFLGVLIAGFVYVWKRGALEWD